MTVWTGDLLDELRFAGDPPADDIAAAYLDDSGGGFFRALLEAAGADPEIGAYLASADGLPEWADAAKLRAGADFFSEWGLEIGLGLFCFSLPAGYASARIAHVLDLTARMETDARRRIFETAQMVLDVTTPGGLDAGATGYVTARRVRLMHAGVRRLITTDPRVDRRPTGAESGWDGQWGVPINQEHLIATVLAFGWAMIGVLDALHVRYEPDGATAYLHLWDVVGHLMGVRPDLLPLDPAEAPALQALIERRNFEATTAGHRMTAALVDVLRETGPGFLLRGLPIALMREFLGDATADLAGVPAAGWSRRILRAGQPLAAWLSDEVVYERVIRRLVRRVSRTVMDGFVAVERGSDRPAYAIPTHLGWGGPGSAAQ